MNKLEIKLANGHKIVAELCDYGHEIPPEIVVCIQDEEGVALQDIVLVRANEKGIGIVDDVNIGTEVLVWVDEDNEDYTHKFKIDELDFGELLQLKEELYYGADICPKMTEEQKRFVMKQCM